MCCDELHHPQIHQMPRRPCTHPPHVGNKRRSHSINPNKSRSNTAPPAHPLAILLHYPLFHRMLILFGWHQNQSQITCKNRMGRLVLSVFKCFIEPTFTLAQIVVSDQSCIRSKFQSQFLAMEPFISVWLRRFWKGSCTIFGNFMCDLHWPLCMKSHRCRQAAHEIALK